jgi:hypothetical protein
MMLARLAESAASVLAHGDRFAGAYVLQWCFS